MSGVTFNVYWTTLFLSHLGVFLVPTTLCLIIVIAAQVGGPVAQAAVVQCVWTKEGNVLFNDARNIGVNLTNIGL